MTSPYLEQPLRSEQEAMRDIEERHRILRQARAAFDLGAINLRLGDRTNAEYWFEREQRHLRVLSERKHCPDCGAITDGDGYSVDETCCWYCKAD